MVISVIKTEKEIEDWKKLMKNFSTSEFKEFIQGFQNSENTWRENLLRNRTSLQNSAIHKWRERISITRYIACSQSEMNGLDQSEMVTSFLLVNHDSLSFLILRLDFILKHLQFTYEKLFRSVQMIYLFAGPLRGLIYSFN